MAKSVTHLTFTLVPRERGDRRVTHVWRVENTANDWLGFIQWKSTWRRYTFWPRPGTIFDAECMRELADFCEWRTYNRKTNRRPMTQLERACRSR